MTDTFEQKYEIVNIEDLDMHDEVRKQFEARGHETSRQSVRPTQLGMEEPSKPLKPFCPKCGVSTNEPFGSHVTALGKLSVGSTVVEVYQCGGIMIYTPHDVATTQSKSRGPGTSGQLGFTRVVITPLR